MGQPVLACCNFLPDGQLQRLCHQITVLAEWIRPSISKNFPETPAAESALALAITWLHPLKLRYHCAFERRELGAEDPEETGRTMQLFQKVCHLVAKLGGGSITIHVGGLGRESAFDLCSAEDPGRTD